MRNALRFALVFVVSALLTAYAIEVHLAFEQRNQAGRIVRAAARAGIDADRRTVGEVVDDLRKEGVDAQPFFRLISRARDIMPLGNTPERTIVFCNELGRYMVFRADRHGFNNPDEVWDRGRIDLALLGDSFVQGACEPDGHGFASLLRADVPALLNLGVGGNEPQLDLATLTEYAVPMHVRSALWFHFTGNDLSEMMAHRSNVLLGRYLEDGFSQDLLHRRADVERAMVDFYAGHAGEVAAKAEPEAVLEELDWMRVLRLANVRRRLGLTIPSGEPIDFERFARVVERARAVAEKAQIRLAFVILPSHEQLDPESVDPSVRATERILRASGLPVFDLREVFRREGAEAVYAFGAEGGHLSIWGNEIVAEYVREQVLPVLGLEPGDATGDPVTR